ncbi:hypothetical protein [Streptosporangium sp. OZ121]|uniref:hypothetical protein n=1 Tax=Streptosporangium sp. OZ121 TaxID=3444183 RepID=UPI003F7A2D18
MSFVPRSLRPTGVVEVDGWKLKRYELTGTGAPVDPGLVAAAAPHIASLLPSELRHPALRHGGEPIRFGFLLLHQTQDALWLNLYTWVHSSIIHGKAAWLTLARPEEGFRILDEPFLGCVWELPLVAHERSSWVRHMMMGPGLDPRAYLADSVEATVGLP